MPNFSAEEIEKLCDKWCAASLHPKGGLVIGETEKYRLLSNGVRFHELDLQGIFAALIGLSKVLLHPGLNIVVHEDHYGIWSWCGEVLLAPRSGLFPEEQMEIHSLYARCINAALAGYVKPTETDEEWQEQQRIQELQTHHAKQLVRNSHLVLAYLTFPLLEAVLKRACAGYVSFDGRVVSAFSVPGKPGKPKRKSYAPEGMNRCNSLRDLMFLHSSIVASDSQKILLENFRSHLSTLDPTQDPFDLIYDWRNQSLHGSTNFSTIGGTLLNLALMISFFEIEDDFEARRKTTIEYCKLYAKMPFKPHWSFYPPH